MLLSLFSRVFTCLCRIIRKTALIQDHVQYHRVLTFCHPVSPSERTKLVVIQGDITDYSSVLEASRGVDVVIHTASLVDVWHRIPETLIYSVNVTGETSREW